MSEDIPESVTSTLSKLPPELQSVIRRKCSRDPKTRFTYKIHLLLAFILTNTQLEEEVGIGWVSEQEFRINKKRLVELLGIKMNSMNVNLHDLGFHKMQHDKGGWTRWTRDGFTQNRILMDTNLDPPNSETPKTRKFTTIEIEELSQTFTLGAIMKSASDLFLNSVLSLWKSLFQQEITDKINAKLFIEKLATATIRPEQPWQNAVDVIEAIVINNGQTELTYTDLLRFMAIFGPIETSMIKIGHLAKCTLSTHWVFFREPKPNEIVSMNFYGYFDTNEINCFVISLEGGITKKVWNMPLIDAYGCYLVDEKVKTYPSWLSFYEHVQKL